VRQGPLRFRLRAPPAAPDRPLIRRRRRRQGCRCGSPPADWRALFREASWEEALDLAAARSRTCATRTGPKALAGFGSAKGSNEEAYLFQKLVRTGFGSNNVDHCTRLCHASSVAALLEGVGSGAVSNPVNDVRHAELIFVIGCNPTVNHPVAATWMKNAASAARRSCWPTRAAPTSVATPGAAAVQVPTPTWPCSTR
jgi:formate dehydrogenase major subunit